MKRVVVFLLTAVLITGVCMTPTIAYATATSVGSKTADADDSGGKGVVDDAEGTESESSNKDKGTGNKAGVSNEDTDTSDEDVNNESTKGVADGTEDTGESGDETTTDSNEVVDVETVPESFEDLTIDKNLAGLRNYLTPASPDGRGTFLIKNDIILLGYNFSLTDPDSNDNPVNGFLRPDITYMEDLNYNLAYSYMDEELAEDEDALTAYVHNVIPDVYTIDDAIKYVKDNIDALRLKSKGKNGYNVLVPNMGDHPERLVAFDGNTGDLLGYIVDSIDESKELYDESICGLSADVETSLSYNEDKSEARLSFSYVLDYPKAFGGVSLTSFKVTDSTGENTYIFGSDSLKYLGDNVNQASGTVKDIPITDENASLLVLQTTVSDYTVNFTVDKLNNEPKQVELSDAKPNVTFEVESGEHTVGTSVAVTMYSDIPAVLTFNGRSSGAPVKQYVFYVSQNGTYAWTARSEAGVTSEGEYSVNSFQNSVLASNYGNYGTGGISSLPKTGGINTVAVILSGLMLVLGGIAIVKKESLVALALALGRKVSKVC